MKIRATFWRTDMGRRFAVILGSSHCPSREDGNPGLHGIPDSGFQRGDVRSGLFNAISGKICPDTAGGGQPGRDALLLSWGSRWTR